MKSDNQIRTEVRDHYSAIARGAAGCCGGGSGDAVTATRRLGYSDAEIAAAPQAANLGLGCGNPQALADLRAGEVVVDLGAGGGFDAFIAGRAVGPTGRVIGVDMSADMVALARTNADLHGATNVDFRLGEIEHLPIADASADVVISNCVINLAPDKRAVYAEAFRVLRPGGRLAISDVVGIAPMPAAMRDNLLAFCGCMAGAALAVDIEAWLHELGFVDVTVEPDPGSAEVIASWEPNERFERFVASARISATKPGSGARSDVGVKPGAKASASAKASGACCEPGCCR